MRGKHPEGRMERKGSKSKKRTAGRRLLSSLLAVVTAMTLIPVSGLTANAAETLRYDGEDFTVTASGNFAGDFNIIWSLFSTERASYRIHIVDKNGNTISTSGLGDVTVNGSMSVSFTDNVPTVDGYEYQEAKLDSFEGKTVTKVQFSTSDSTKLAVGYYNGDESVDDSTVDLTDSSAEETRNVYFVYKKNSESKTFDTVELNGATVAFSDIPSGTSGAAELIIKDSDDYKSYEEKALTYLHENIDEDVTIADSRFLEIHLEKDGEKVQPEGTVDVKISLSTPLDGDTITMVTGNTVDTDNLITLPMTVSGLTADDSVTLRAVYSNNVTVTFYDIDNETVLQVEKAEPGSTLDLSEYEAVPANPQTQQFIGWSTEKDQTSSPISNSYTVPNSSVSLYPVIANGYWLRFDSQGGTAEPSIFVQENQAAGTLPTPTRAGYDFEGWYTSTAGGTFDFPTPLVRGEKVDTPLTGIFYDHSSRIILLMIAGMVVVGIAGFYIRRRRRA